MIVLAATFGLMLAGLVCVFGRAGLARLADVRLHGSALVLLAGLLQAASVLFQQQRLVLLLAAAVLLLGFGWRNRREIGIGIAIVGIAMNVVVMAANGGTMPISPATLQQMSGSELPAGTALSYLKSTVTEPEETRLAWLSDHLLLPGPLAQLAAWSIGDVLLLLGAGWFLGQKMKGQTRDAGTTRWHYNPSS